MLRNSLRKRRKDAKVKIGAKTVKASWLIGLLPSRDRHFLARMGRIRTIASTGVVAPDCCSSVAGFDFGVGACSHHCFIIITSLSTGFIADSSHRCCLGASD